MNIKGILTAFVCCIACAVPVSANASGNYGEAYLIGEIGSESNWSVADDSVEIDGDAKYEYTWNATGDIEYLALCITPSGEYRNFNSITFPSLSVDIDELWIDGARIEDYEMGSNSADMNYFSDGSGITRVYLKTGNTPADINDLAGNDSIKKSIRIVFTVSGLGKEGTSNFVEVRQPEKAETSATSEVKKTETTTATTKVTAVTSSTTAPDIDSSAPTGDQGIATVLAVTAVSATVLAFSKSKRKK